jgi:nucleoside-diphosphate-sugar epimerase
MGQNMANTSIGSNAIIGSNGFIGSALKRYADKYLDKEWIGITRKNWKQWKGYHFGNIIWAAGTARKDLSKIKTNALNVHYVVKAISDFKFDKFIYISSQAVYGDSIGHEDDKISSDISYYGATKYSGESITKILKSYLIVRPNGFTGPGLKKNAVFSMSRNPPELYYSWDSKAQYIHVDYFAHIFFNLAKGYNNETFNVSSPDAVTPVDIANILGIDLKTVQMPKDRVLPHVQAIIDVSKMEAALNKMGIETPSSVEAIKTWNEPLEVQMSSVRERMGKCVSGR